MRYKTIKLVIVDGLVENSHDSSIAVCTRVVNSLTSSAIDDDDEFC